ncbi:unnamed protein product [Heterotrigona itama]|uniref:Uncharacterized protein n=1 Tax=Heterotrigona itama TaxID=395501 RepID=A0A6V7H582_9HYME|nr:unnamed protein product [Heterotrigona itama]
MKLFQTKVMISIDSTIKQLVPRKSHFALPIDIIQKTTKQNEISPEKKSHRNCYNFYQMVRSRDCYRNKIIDNLQVVQNLSPCGSNVRTEISECLQIRRAVQYLSKKALTECNRVGVSFMAGNETRGVAKSAAKRTALNRDGGRRARKSSASAKRFLWHTRVWSLVIVGANVLRQIVSCTCQRC